MNEALVRRAIAEDAGAVQAIYAHSVAHSTATFDTVAPDFDFWRDKIAALAAAGSPFLVIEQDARVAGFAYAARFRDRAAYAATCEDSIYLAPWAAGRGLGTRLLGELIAAARTAGFEQMIAVIGGGEPASVALHSRLGFAHAGRMRAVGTKFGRKLDTVYMQRDLTREQL